MSSIAWCGLQWKNSFDHFNIFYAFRCVFSLYFTMARVLLLFPSIFFFTHISLVDLYICERRKSVGTYTHFSFARFFRKQFNVFIWLMICYHAVVLWLTARRDRSQYIAGIRTLIYREVFLKRSFPFCYYLLLNVISFSLRKLFLKKNSLRFFIVVVRRLKQS